VIETLRTESFLTNMRLYGCFSLTDMVGAMNSGIRVRESIRFNALAIDARGRSAEGRSMDRDLGTPKKSQESTSLCAVGLCAVWADATSAPGIGLSMKQTCGALGGLGLDMRLRLKRTTKTAPSTRSFTGEH
jgi:hypothetical protein